MIHKSLDSLILQLGGISNFIKELKKEGIEISFSGVKKWYTSNQINPSQGYREAIKRIAKREGREVQF